MKLKKLMKKIDAQNLVSVYDRAGSCIAQGDARYFLEMDSLKNRKVVLISASRSCLNTIHVTVKEG